MGNARSKSYKGALRRKQDAKPFPLLPGSYCDCLLRNGSWVTAEIVQAGQAADGYFLVDLQYFDVSKQMPIAERRDQYELGKKFWRALAPQGSMTDVANRETSNSMHSIASSDQDLSRSNPTTLRQLSDMGRELFMAAASNSTVAAATESGAEKISLGDMVDVRTSSGRWVVATIDEFGTSDDHQAVVQVLYQDGRQEWIPLNSDRFAVFGTKSMIKQHAYSLRQMVDCLDYYKDRSGQRRQKWRICTIIGIDNNRIQVHWEGFSAAWDCWMDVCGSDKNRVAPPFSRSEQESAEQRRKRLRDENFVQTLALSGFRVVEQEADGNCLFRSVSHQIWGDASRHDELRHMVCGYLESNQQHFQQGCVTMSFNEYLAKMRQPMTWGGDLEIQAMEEMFDRIIDIHTCDADGVHTGPMSRGRVVPPEMGNRERMHISYHGRSHYNSLMPADRTAPLGLATSEILMNFRILQQSTGRRGLRSQTTSLFIPDWDVESPRTRESKFSDDSGGESKSGARAPPTEPIEATVVSSHLAGDEFVENAVILTNSTRAAQPAPGVQHLVL